MLSRTKLASFLNCMIKGAEYSGSDVFFLERARVIIETWLSLANEVFLTKIVTYSSKELLLEVY